MTPQYKSKLETEFDIAIFNFMHLGGAYKAQFAFVYSPTAGINKTVNVVVRRKERYNQAIARVLSH